MGIIKKQNDEAFWIGANVGLTESISHIPTQITRYKGINAPLTNWEYSFFKGYLFRENQKIKYNKVYLRIICHVKSIQVGSVSGYAYIQNCTVFDDQCRFILLNKDKKKIDQQGNILAGDDKSCFGTKNSYDFPCYLPSGQYYYREIRISNSRLIAEDIPFTVIDSDEIQYILIDHSPNLFKMYYKGTFSEEDIFPDLSLYYNDIDTSTDILSSSYYKDSNTLSFTHRYTMKPLWRISYNITGVEYNGKNVDELFNFGWIDDEMSGNNCGFSKLPYNDDCVTAVKLGDKYGTVNLNESGSLTKDRYNVYKSSGLQMESDDVMLPTYMSMEYLPNSKNYQTVARSYFMMEEPRYECDIKRDDLTQIVKLSDTGSYIPTGYLVSHNHISGVSCVSYDANIDTIKNTHFIIKQSSMTRTTLQKEVQEESYMWEGNHDDTTTVTGGESTTYPSTATLTPPTDAIKFIGGRAARVYFEDKCISSLPSLQTLFYYESVNGDIEACSNYSAHISDSGNPTISDENILKAFIGTPIVYEQVKQGYEDYDFD